MAETVLTVTSPYAFAPDLVTLKEASALFAETGHPVDSRKLKRWAIRHGITVERCGSDNIASWSDLLEVHAREVDAEQAGRVGRPRP